MAGPDDPLECGIGPWPPGLTLPLDVLDRLHARARADHLVTADGAPDLGALMDIAMLEEGDGQITVAAAHRLIYAKAKADPDLGLLVREVVRGILVRDGYVNAAATLQSDT